MAMDQLYTDALKELEAVKTERDEYRNHLAAIAEMTGNGNDIGAAHEGVNALIEDLARHKRMFVAACETLGEIQQALGNDIVGIEPTLVKELADERDALAAHVERLRSAMNEASDKHIAFAKRIMQGIDSTAMAAVDKADALLVREGFNVPVDTATLARRDALKQAEALEEAAGETVPAMHQMANWLLARAADKRQQAEGHQ